MDIFGLETKPAEPICEELERQLENLLALRKKLRRKAVIRISLIIYAAYISLFAAASSRARRSTFCSASIAARIAAYIRA
jgi:hypothetical protein